MAAVFWILQIYGIVWHVVEVCGVLDLKQMIGKYKNKKDLIVGLSVYIGGSIFGPLIFFVAGGFLIDKYNGTKPLYTLIGLGVAFVTTNIILFKKAKGIYKHMTDKDEKKQSDVNSIDFTHDQKTK